MRKNVNKNGLLVSINKELLEHQEELETKSEKLNEANTEITRQKDSYRADFESIKMLSELGSEITASLDISKIKSLVYTDIKNLLPADIFNIGIYNKKIIA